MVKSFTSFNESSRIIFYSDLTKDLSGLDKEDIENIFQDFLDDYPFLYLQIDSVNFFNTSDNPFMVSVYGENPCRFDMFTIYTWFSTRTDGLMDQIDSRLSDYNLTIRDCRLVNLPMSRIYGQRFESNVMVIRINRIK